MPPRFLHTKTCYSCCKVLCRFVCVCVCVHMCACMSGQTLRDAPQIVNDFLFRWQKIQSFFHHLPTFLSYFSCEAMCCSSLSYIITCAKRSSNIPPPNNLSSLCAIQNPHHFLSCLQPPSTYVHPAFISRVHFTPILHSHRCFLDTAHEIYMVSGRKHTHCLTYF